MVSFDVPVARIDAKGLGNGVTGNGSHDSGVKKVWAANFPKSV